MNWPSPEECRKLPPLERMEIAWEVVDPFLLKLKRGELGKFAEATAIRTMRLCERRKKLGLVMNVWGDE